MTWEPEENVANATREESRILRMYVLWQRFSQGGEIVVPGTLYWYFYCNG